MYFSDASGLRMADQPSNPYTFFGITTFGKVDHIPVDQDWTADVGVLGVPFDLGTGYRSGARFGPKAIRDISVRYRLGGTKPGFWDLRTGRHKAACRIVDLGDVVTAPLDWSQCFDNITRDVGRILSKGAFPVVLGGDHSITYPVMRAFQEDEPVTIVHFDAHTDYREQVLGVRFGHGSAMRRCSELSCVTNVCSIGIRSLRTIEEEVNELKQRGNTLIPAWDVHENGVASIVERLPSGKRVYISFDIDGMDPSIAPGTGTPEVGGLTFPQARALLEAVCERNKVVGLDLVELNPQYDSGQITALLATQIIVETIGFVFDGAR
jgi:agmatinase